MTSPAACTSTPPGGSAAAECVSRPWRPGNVLGWPAAPWRGEQRSPGKPAGADVHRASSPTRRYIFQHSASIFPALERAGYWTGGFGKIINGQKRQFKPQSGEPITDGWTWLSAPMDEGDYFGADHFEKRPGGKMQAAPLLPRHLRRPHPQRVATHCRHSCFGQMSHSWLH